MLAILIWLLGQGFIVSQAVDFLKRIQFVADHPKLIAAILNVVAVAAVSFLNIAGLGEAISGFLLALIAGLLGAAASVASYEVKKAALG